MHKVRQMNKNMKKSKEAVIVFDNRDLQISADDSRAFGKLLAERSDEKQ